MVDFSDPGKRLLYALEQRGFEMRGNQINREAAAEKLGVKAVTLRQQINRGQLSREYAIQYAKRLRKPDAWLWLLYGEGHNPFLDAEKADVNESSTSQEESGTLQEDQEGVPNMKTAIQRISKMLEKFDLSTAAHIVDTAFDIRERQEKTERRINPPDGA